jgi:hypothetical protein
MVCLECRAIIDSCWRWCPECGSQILDRPGWGDEPGHQDGYFVEWAIEEAADADDAVNGSALRSA